MVGGERRLGTKHANSHLAFRQIKSKNIGRGHINGWNAGWGDWEWDGGRLQEMDSVLAKAAELGVRLIIPLLNQDYGDESTNWVGNHTDLIRMVRAAS